MRGIIYETLAIGSLGVGAHGGGLEFVILYLDYKNEKTDYRALDAWAIDVLKKNQNRRAIVVSDDILAVKGDFDPRGQAIYNNLKNQPNLFLMLCGHNHGEVCRQLTNQTQIITACLSDYQAYTNGGNGFLRLYRFSPSNDAIRVQTYSPWLDQYRTNATSQFEITYPMSR